MRLSSEEQSLCDAIGFPPSIAERLKAEARVSLRQLMGFDLQQDKIVLVLGISVGLEASDTSSNDKENLVTDLNEQFESLGYRAFYSDSYEIGVGESGDEVAIIKTDDSLNFVRIRATCGANFDISNDALLNKLQEWRSRCGLTITGAAGDWVAIDFDSLPEKICAFAEEVYEFCPDSVDQGVGLMQEEDDPEFFREARELCSGISDAMKQKILADFKEVDDEDLSEEEKTQGVAETEMGILLLANYIKTYGSLFLWWD